VDPDSAHQEEREAEPAGAEPDPAEGTSRLHSRDRRVTERRILDATWRLFDQDGPLAGINLQRVADEAGVNRSLVYQYLGTREDLVRTALTERLKRGRPLFRLHGVDVAVAAAGLRQQAPGATPASGGQCFRLTKRPRYLGGDRLRVVPHDERRKAQHPVTVDGQLVAAPHVRPPGAGFHMPAAVDFDDDSSPLPHGIQPSTYLAVRAFELTVRLGQPETPHQVAQIKLG
jgi:hypothetical protein